MKKPLVLDHTRQPLYRVVRRGWKHPLDASYSRLNVRHRWNTEDYPALYCCATAAVARAVTMDIFRYAGIVADDLRPELHPQLVEITWQGTLVDVATAKGVRAAGLPSTYPEGVSREDTQAAAARWHEDGAEGVACRSASLHRLRFSRWTGDYTYWSELAIFTDNAKRPPKLLRRVTGLKWLDSHGASK